MTPAQMLVLKNDILVTNVAALQAFIDAVDDQSIADWYNVETSPVFWAYRSRLTKDEIYETTSQDGTTFDMTGNGFIDRKVQEIMAWQEMFSTTRAAIDPSRQTTRKNIADIFSGPNPAAANIVHIRALSRIKVSRIQRLFVTGTGTIGAPGTMGFEGVIDYLTVARAWHDAGV